MSEKKENVCKNCSSPRIAKVLAKNPDGYSVCIMDVEYQNPVANNIFDGEYVDFAVCLDCGSVQGNFPVKIESDPFVPPELPPETHTTPKEFIKDCMGHSCGSDQLIPSDNPMALRLGFICKQCGWRVSMGLERFRSNWGKFSYLRNKFVTAEGRREIFCKSDN